MKFSIDAVLLLHLMSWAVTLDGGFPLSLQFRKYKITYKKEGLKSDDPGDPLYLSPYIAKGQVEQGIANQTS